MNACPLYFRRSMRNCSMGLFWMMIDSTRPYLRSPLSRRPELKQGCTAVLSHLTDIPMLQQPGQRLADMIQFANSAPGCCKAVGEGGRLPRLHQPFAAEEQAKTAVYLG